MIALCLVISTAHARQYIQCSSADSTDMAVINLDGEDSSLFLTSGVHTPDHMRIIKKLNFVEENATHTIYATDEGEVREVVTIANEYVGRAYNLFELKLTLMNQSRKADILMKCFSAIYE